MGEGISLQKEARYWERSDGTNEKKKSNGSTRGTDKDDVERKKDSNNFVFDSMFLNSLKIGGAMIDVIETCSNKLLHYVDELERTMFAERHNHPEQDEEEDTRTGLSSSTRMAGAIQGHTGHAQQLMDPNALPPLSTLLVVEVMSKVGF